MEMGKTVDVIKISYASLRSRYGKLKKKRSFSGDMELTESGSREILSFLALTFMKFRKRP